MEENSTTLEKFVKVEDIGEGMFGKVCKIENIETREVFAAKILNSPINDASNDILISISREVNYISGMNHPSVLKFIGYSPTNFEGLPNPVIITEYCKNGSLMKFIESSNQYTDNWNDTKKLITLFGIASGMKYLHDHDIVHRDLKPENILMDGRLCPKIGDFGFAKRINSNGICISINESTKDAKGTPIYMAPEVFETKESTKASDVYAFGMIAYEIITENIPYKEFDCIQLLLSVQRGRRPPFDKPINDSYRNLIEKCWSQDPAERPTFGEIVEEFINDEGFITKEVNEKDFRSYTKFLEEYPSSFDINKIIRPDDYIQIASKTFHEIDVKRYHEQQNKTTFSTFLSRMGISRESLCPKYVLDKLDTKCQRLIFEAEHDEEKQYYIGTYFIESKCEFPLNVSVGVKYLEYSISKGNINSIVYLSKMLLKGILIEKNYEKANAYLSKIYKKDDRIYYLYGKVLKKQKNFKESYKKFKEGSEKLIPECIYELGKLLFCGKGCKKNIQNAFYYFDLSKKEGVHKSELYLAILDELNRFESFFNLSTEDKHFFIKQVIKYNLENDEIINYKKIEMKFNDTENRFIQKSFESTDFVIILKKFDSILIEISNQSKHFESILQQLANIKHNIGLNMMIFVYISKIQKISSEFDQYNVISVIDIGSTVLKIQKSAFKGCLSLTQITIPSSVTSIEEYSFAGCQNLTIINFTPNIKSIEKHTFDGCSSLKQISIPYSVTSIGKYAFNNCKSLKEITIPYLVTSIGKHSFAGCENLTEIIITSPINTIEKHTFDGCSSLKKILIPYSVTSIGKYAFNECMSLEQIVIPSVTSIGNNAFYRCSSMTNVCIDPSSTITSIQNSTFELCTSLTEISIPQSVTSISQFAFRSCKKLKEIKINCRINKIESNAFDDCPSLQIIPKSKTYQLKEFQNHFLHPININIIVIGGCGVGKTSIVNRYVDDEFQENTLRTLSFNLRTKHINIGGNNVNLQIWDTSSSESYYSVIRRYCKSETCAIIVTDFTGSYSHNSLQYLNELQNDIGPIPAVILRNKCDLTGPNIELVKELENFQREYNFPYFDVSAKNNVNVDEAFHYVVNEAFHHIKSPNHKFINKK